VTGVAASLDSRARMVRSAALLFRERGYSATGFRDVIAHSGAPRGSIYHHFPGGKAQLAEEAVAYASDAVVAQIDALARERDPSSLLEAFLAPWRETLQRSDFRAGCPVVAIAVETGVPPQLAAAAAAAFERWEARLAARLRDAGVPAARCAGVAALAVAGVEGAIVLCRARRDTAPLDRVAAELMATIAAVRAGGARPPRRGANLSA
jgi:AcrR family transcriptional regulator